AIASYYKEYATIGRSTANLLAVGESGYSCSGIPAGTPAAGLLLDGDYSKVMPFDHLKIAEFVTSSWYTYPEGDKGGRHPWQGETNPHYSGPALPYKRLSDGQKYTWTKAPRYDGRPVQVGPNARLLSNWQARRCRRSGWRLKISTRPSAGLFAVVWSQSWYHGS